eukprot:8251226-Pyramimonas_sp.AAC.1
MFIIWLRGGTHPCWHVEAPELAQAAPRPGHVPSAMDRCTVLFSPHHGVSDRGACERASRTES